jgi:hypothetical protein
MREGGGNLLIPGLTRPTEGRQIINELLVSCGVLVMGWWCIGGLCIVFGSLLVMRWCYVGDVLVIRWQYFGGVLWRSLG